MELLQLSLLAIHSFIPSSLIFSNSFPPSSLYPVLPHSAFICFLPLVFFWFTLSQLSLSSIPSCHLLCFSPANLLLISILPSLAYFHLNLMYKPPRLATHRHCCRGGWCKRLAQHVMTLRDWRDRFHYPSTVLCLGAPPPPPPLRPADGSAWECLLCRAGE